MVEEIKEVKKTENPEVVQAELEGRVKRFNEELIPLLGKWKLGLTARVVVTNDGRLVGQPYLVDDIKTSENKEKVEPEVGEKKSAGNLAEA
jgi:hypothetical protein